MAVLFPPGTLRRCADKMGSPWEPSELGHVCVYGPCHSAMELPASAAQKLSVCHPKHSCSQVLLENRNYSHVCKLEKSLFRHLYIRDMT